MPQVRVVYDPSLQPDLNRTYRAKYLEVAQKPPNFRGLTC